MKDYVTAGQRLGRKDIEESWFYRIFFTVVVVGLVGIIIAI